MEIRHGKIIAHASGGTAGKDSNTYKITLPSLWIKEMNLSENEREVELSFDGSRITIEKKLTFDEYIESQKAKGHTLKKLTYYNDKNLCTTIIIDITEKKLRAKNHTENIIKTAFGKNVAPTWDDLQGFLEERCIARSRAGLREYLETIGVDEYDPIEIIKKTKGRMAEDSQWIEIEDLI